MEALLGQNIEQKLSVNCRQHLKDLETFSGTEVSSVTVGS